MHDHGGLSVVHISKQMLTLKITVGSLLSTCCCFGVKCTHMLDSLVRTATNGGDVGTSNRADACAFTSEPQLLLSSIPWSVSRDIPEKLAHMLGSLVRITK